MKKILKAFAQKFGYDILHTPTNPISRQWLDLINSNNVNVILDIGANTGQYGRKIRKTGYKGYIVSFEPVYSVYEQLKANTATDPRWQAIRTGVGNYDGIAEINIANNSYSSSILTMLERHIESVPGIEYTHTESISIQKIDTFIDKYNRFDNIYIKMDTQGYERQVWEGCLKSLNKIVGMQMELSLVPLYEGETLLQEMINLLRTYGYKLKLIESGHKDYKTGEIIQVEAYFFR